MKWRYWPWAIAFLCGDCEAREFGPEWMRANDGYRKEIKVPVVHFYSGNVSNYHTQMESDWVDIAESDDNQGFSVLTKFGYFEVRKDAAGAATSHTVGFPMLGSTKVVYHDLNGDGVLDVMHDMREPSAKSFIVLDGCFVLVWGSLRGGPHTKTAMSPDRKTHYIFESSAWRIKK